MRVCAAIVLYHPEKEKLLHVIGAVITQVEMLILVNNTEGEQNFELQDAVNTCEAISAVSDGENYRDKIKWINNNENLGIAKALNQALTTAVKHGFKWLLTLDQDSISSEGMVDTLFEAAAYCDNAAMVSPKIIEQGKVWEDIYEAKRRKKDNREQSDIESVTFCITSGTLTKVEAVQSVGGWDEKLFIDEVDRDICIRLRYRGHRLLRVNTTELHHEFGNDLIERRILFKTYKYRNYSPFRVYYQIRNLVYMIRKYGADYKPHPAWQRIRPFFTFFIKFIFEPQRLKRLGAFIRGYCAGLVMRL